MQLHGLLDALPTLGVVHGHTGGRSFFDFEGRFLGAEGGGVSRRSRNKRWWVRGPVRGHCWAWRRSCSRFTFGAAASGFDARRQL